MKQVFRKPMHGWLLGGYLVFWLALAITPNNRMDWALENLLILLSLGAVIFLYRSVPLSTASYCLIALFLCFHTVGAHYTYAQTPFGWWMAESFDLTRNHYDRVIHFTFGAMIYWPFREIFARHAGLKHGWLELLTLSFIASASAAYELLEWGAALIFGGEAALAFLGTQGDVFDAQKDSGLAIIGAAIAMALAAWRYRGHVWRPD